MLCFKCLYRLPCCVVMVVTAVALEVVVATTARVFGSGGGCRSPSSIIGTGGLPRASCRRNMCLCTQGGLGSCAFIAITRHIQVPTPQLAVCEFGMNVLVCTGDRKRTQNMNVTFNVTLHVTFNITYQTLYAIYNAYRNVVHNDRTL